MPVFTESVTSVLWTKPLEVNRIPKPTRFTAYLHNALKCFAQSVFSQENMYITKIENKSFIVIGLSKKFFLRVESIQFYTKANTSKMCLETSEPLQDGLALTQSPAVTKQMPASKVN